MKSMLSVLALASLALLGAAPASASAAVTVSYVHPEKFIDLADNDTERERVLKEFDQYFAQLSKPLPPGQNLSIEVLDIDLAGRIEPTSRLRDLRILTGGADWPTMQLRYRLEANGQVLASGEDRLSNMVYLDRLNHYNGSDPLRYEKQMIDEWFNKKFVVARPG
ncbi:MAG: DUF3016 domain-containing protein [Massilia sp.]